MFTSCFLGDQRWARRARLHVQLTPVLRMGGRPALPEPQAPVACPAFSPTFVASLLDPKPLRSEEEIRWPPHTLPTPSLRYLHLGRRIGAGISCCCQSPNLSSHYSSPINNVLETSVCLGNMVFGSKQVPGSPAQHLILTSCVVWGFSFLVSTMVRGREGPAGCWEPFVSQGMWWFSVVFSPAFKV